MDVVSVSVEDNGTGTVDTGGDVSVLCICMGDGR